MKLPVANMSRAQLYTTVAIISNLVAKPVDIKPAWQNPYEYPITFKIVINEFMPSKYEDSVNFREMRRTIAQAFHLWEKYTALQFVEVRDDDIAEIEISFQDFTSVEHLEKDCAARLASEEVTQVPVVEPEPTTLKVDYDITIDDEYYEYYDADDGNQPTTSPSSLDYTTIDSEFIENFRPKRSTMYGTFLNFNDCNGKSHGVGEPYAHAFQPEKVDVDKLDHRYVVELAGDIHFASNFNWVYREPIAYENSTEHNLFGIAVHEIGHALGLAHVNNPRSVMHVTTHRSMWNSTTSLHTVDQRAIISMYGEPRRFWQKIQNQVLVAFVGSIVLLFAVYKPLSVSEVIPNNDRWKSYKRRTLKRFSTKRKRDKREELHTVVEVENTITIVPEPPPKTSIAKTQMEAYSRNMYTTPNCTEETQLVSSDTIILPSSNTLDRTKDRPVSDESSNTVQSAAAMFGVVLNSVKK